MARAGVSALGPDSYEVRCSGSTSFVSFGVHPVDIVE